MMTMSHVTNSPSSVKELLWLSCREKTCCHTTKVILTGKDLWRISQMLELMPWDFTLYCDAEPGAVDGFQLTAEGTFYQVILAKRQDVSQQGHPCIFLWKLADGHAQCGLGDLRPMTCQSYPTVRHDDLLWVDGRACTCRRWSPVDVNPWQEMPRLATLLQETSDYQEIVAAWNQRVVQEAREFTYQEYCTYLLHVYQERDGGES
jgi:Fe-S-cluster containining protein